MRPHPTCLHRIVGATWAALCCLAIAEASETRLPHASPEAAGLNAAKLAEIDGVVAEALSKKQMPGCVVLIARQGQIVWLRAYGNRRVAGAETNADGAPASEPMTTDTVFDLASLTKPVATATSIMLLAEQGKLDVDDPVAKHWPEFGQAGKDSITIRQLLTHQGGLIPDNDITDYADGPARAFERIAAAAPQHPPRAAFRYSDVGFIVLGEVVHRVSGNDLREFTAQHVFEPLGMRETGYLPSEALRARAAPTQERDGHWMQGEVHDPRAYALGGVAGHAGLFSTAEDLAIYAQMILGHGEHAGVRVLQPATVAAMLTPCEVPGGGLRALGWDVRTGYSSNRGEGFSDAAVGHGGFTGTALWIDPGLDLCVVFLSNRVHPDVKGNVNHLAGRIGTIAAAAIEKE